MKNIARILAFALPVVVAIQGCKKDNGPQPSSHEYYQPVKVGEWYRYAVDSSYWNHQNHVAGKVLYTLIENYDTDVPNNAGKLETRIKIERIDAQPRRVVGFSYIQRFFNNAKQQYSVERVDGDVRYVLFRAPLLVPDTFNRNSKNLLPADIWKNMAVGVNGSGLGGNYEYTMRLTRFEHADSLVVINDYELYAFNVGMYKKERTYLLGRTDTANWQHIPVEQRIDTGFSYTKVMVDRGQIK